MGTLGKLVIGTYIYLAPITKDFIFKTLFTGLIDALRSPDRVFRSLASTVEIDTV